MPPARRQLLREINRSQVLNAIRTDGPISRINLSKLTGLSQSTITSISALLIEEDIIFETQVGDSTGGRPPILLDLNPESLFVIGIKLTENHIFAVLTDIKAVVREAFSFDAPAGDRTMDWGVNFIREAVEQTIAESGVKRAKLAGVGIGMAGIFDHGICRQSAFFDWHDEPVRDLVEASIGLPTYIDNDVNTLTIAEEWFGYGKEVDNLVVVTLGRGIGMGILVDGRFYGGAQGGAGQLGHTVVDPDGPFCSCGKQGCLETFVNDSALLKAASDIANTNVTMLDLVDLLETNTDIQAEIERRAHLLGRSLANVVNLLDPSILIITGEGTWIGDRFFEPVRMALAQHTLPDLQENFEVVIREWGDDIWAHGAACLVLKEVYKSPVSTFETTVS